jgi:hypothetical protein
MPTNLLILPLIAGYCFLHFLAYTRYRAQRLDGHRLVLECLFFALPLSLIGRLAAFVLWQVPFIRDWWVRFAPQSSNFDYFGTALLTVMGGILIPPALNLIGEKLDRYEACRKILSIGRIYSHRRALSTAMERYGTELHRLFYRALDSERLVCITLDTKKVYIGYVAGAPKLEPFDVYVSIIPVLSGYRDVACLDLKLTQNYIAVYDRDKLDRANFVVVLPLTQIRGASFFDQEAYTRFEIRPPDASPVPPISPAPRPDPARKT